MSIFPIDLSDSRTRWCAYDSDDARAYAAALATAGIDYECHFVRPAATLQQWTFDRIGPRTRREMESR